MKSVAQEVRKTITERLKAIRTEIGPLVNEEAELVQMVPGESIQFASHEEPGAPVEESAPKPEAATETPTRRRRKRRGGTRAEQAIAWVKDNPGSTASQIASAVGIKPNYLYRVLKELEAEGQLTKDGMKYSVAS